MQYIQPRLNHLSGLVKPVGMICLSNGSAATGAGFSRNRICTSGASTQLSPADFYGMCFAGTNTGPIEEDPCRTGNSAMMWCQNVGFSAGMVNDCFAGNYATSCGSNGANPGTGQICIGNGTDAGG